jgi:ribosomal protein L11 methyltransferase
VATDIDPGALACARAHCDLDAHPVPIELSAAAPDHWGARFDLVVANILEEPLRLLAPALSRALSPTGVMLISGFTRLQAPGLHVCFENEGLVLDRDCAAGEWALLWFTSRRLPKPPPTVAD